MEHRTEAQASIRGHQQDDRGLRSAKKPLLLEVSQGVLFSLLGVNGAGKTTAIRMLSCLAQPTAREAFVGGYSVTKELDQVKQLIGASPQEAAAAPNLSVKENLALICGIHGFSREKNAKILELTEQFSPYIFGIAAPRRRGHPFRNEVTQMEIRSTYTPLGKYRGAPFGIKSLLVHPSNTRSPNINDIAGDGNVHKTGIVQNCTCINGNPAGNDNGFT